MSDFTPSQKTPHCFRLVLDNMGGLFSAPPADPFATGACEILGRAGVDYLHARVKQHWPRTPRFSQIILQLPASALPNEPAALEQLAAETRIALQRYCTEQESTGRMARRLTVRTAMRQTIWAMVLTLFALAFAVAVVNGWPAALLPFVRGILAIVLLLAASLAIWDALDALLFQWAPFIIESHAYRTLARMQIAIEADPAQHN